jgi:hypothetical protein
MFVVQQGLRKMRRLGLRCREFFHNPVWYVATVTVMGVLALSIRFLWWLAGAVALAWGTWLVWQLFAQNEGGTDTEDQLKIYLAQTLAYEVQMDQLLKATSNSSNRAHRLHLATQINIWTEAIQNLIQHIASLRQDTLIRQDMAAVPKAIEHLEAQLAFEADAGICAQLERTLINRKNQLASLQLLQRTAKKAEIQIESTLSLLGTIYSQILIGQSTNHVADYNRLSVDVDEEVNRLQDQLEALWEVKGGYQAGPSYRFSPFDHDTPDRMIH